MTNKSYYSIRSRKNKLGFIKLRKLFLDIYNHFRFKGYFDESFGYECSYYSDVDDTDQYLNKDNLKIIFSNRLKKEGMWPVEEKGKKYKEEDLFDVIELLYDFISMPTARENCSMGNGEWHHSKFNKKQGRIEYRESINELLKDYRSGYNLTEDGQIVSAIETGFESLINEQIPALDPINVDPKIENAIKKFRLYRSSPEERRQSVRELVDVLEYLRPKLESVLDKKDESDLFNIANNFGLRHHNESQKNNYDQDIWLNWMFYFYLSTIFAVIKLINKKSVKRSF